MGIFVDSFYKDCDLTILGVLECVGLCAVGLEVVVRVCGE